MRHGNKINALGRTASHRKAMLSNMACSLIEHKRIQTTVAKAKALRGFIEPLVTKSKVDSTHSRRVVFRNLQNKHAVNELFREVAPKVADRPGGYTRIIKTGNRLGDNAEMCIIELVDFNELMLQEKKDSAGQKKTRRSRRGKSGGSKASGAKKTEAKKEEAPKAEAKKEEAPKAEAKKEEAPKAEAKKDETPKAEAKKEEAPKKEEKKEEPKEDKKDDSKDESKEE